MTKLTMKSGSENYAATIVKIGEILPIEGADKIKKTIVVGNIVIVGADLTEGSVVVYFRAGTQLSEDYCFENNLYDTKENNKDTSKKGYLSFKKRMVRSIKLKGVISDGLLMPVSSLNLNKELLVGEEFTGWDNTELCCKYEPPVVIHNPGTGPKPPKNKVVDHLVDNQFRFHSNTPHLAQNIINIDKGDHVFITRKLHGSSGIVSNCKVKKKLSKKEKFLKFFKIPITTEEYGFVWSSGKPKSEIPKGLESDTNSWRTSNDSFYSSDIWLRAYLELKDKVEKGITLYFEIVGKGIQGPEYTYDMDYGIFVYRITTTNVDGKVIELGWPEVEAYCTRYNIPTVELYHEGMWGTLFNHIKDVNWEDDRNKLEILSNLFLNQTYPDCKIDEGICVRVSEGHKIFKFKSPNFVLKETKELELKEETTEEES